MQVAKLSAVNLEGSGQNNKNVSHNYNWDKFTYYFIHCIHWDMRVK